MIIRFQDLCTEPMRVIPEISAFLGISEMEILYQPTRAGYFYPANNFEQHFSESQRTKALRTHQLMSAMIPRLMRYLKYHHSYF